MIKVLGVVAVIVLGVLIYGDLRWRRETRQVTVGLTNGQRPAAAGFDERELAGLPEPVARYFRRSIDVGVPMPRVVRHTQVGEFAMKGWRPMQAEQLHVLAPPGFVWDASIRMMPGLPVRVRDTYMAGQGTLRARLFGLFPVASANHRPELAEGALQRYLGEAIWFPVALLPRHGVEWTAIDATSARATIRDGEVRASLDFRFNGDGDVTGSYAVGRFKEDQGRFLRQPWEARCWAWERRGGMRIPVESEVAWIEEGRAVPYWRARIASISFER